MNSISNGTKRLFDSSVCLLNKPLVKERIKNIVSTATFVFSIHQILQIPKIKPRTYSEYPKWVQIAHKVFFVCTTISLVLNIGVSVPGAYIISTLVGCAFSTQQLNRVFGPYTTFSVNPWHPRHVLSIAAMILAIPSCAQSVYNAFKWTYKKIKQYQSRPSDNEVFLKFLSSAVALQNLNKQIL